MTSPATTDQELLRNVETLRAQFPQTQELYREVCALLFFRYGVTPTANKLYQLVRKGSMSAPSHALSKFWQDLRNKSRTRIEHPDLPEELGAFAGDMLATLWTKAQTLAHASMEAHRQEADETVARSKSDVAGLQAERDAQQEVIVGLQAELGRATQQITAHSEALAAAHKARSALMDMLESEKLEHRDLQRQLEAARLEFSVELGKLHAAAQLAEERSRATEKRLLVDIDRERTNSAKLQRELEAHRLESARTADNQRLELRATQLRLNESQQEKAKLDGVLHTVTANLERAEAELKALQQAPRSVRAEFGTAVSVGEKKAKSSRRSPKRGRPKTSSTLSERFKLS